MWVPSSPPLGLDPAAQAALWCTGPFTVFQLCYLMLSCPCRDVLALLGFWHPELGCLPRWTLSCGHSNSLYCLSTDTLAESPSIEMPSLVCSCLKDTLSLLDGLFLDCHPPFHSMDATPPDGAILKWYRRWGGWGESSLLLVDIFYFSPCSLWSHIFLVLHSSLHGEQLDIIYNILHVKFSFFREK